MNYIVYSSGVNGYAFYEESENFPENIKTALEVLYTKSTLMNPCRNFSVGVRFAPVKDRFVLSVFFKGIMSESEQRSHSAVVSWVLSSAEADSLLGKNRLTQFSTLIKNSRTLLQNSGYSIPEINILNSSDCTEINSDKVRSLYSALIFSSRAFNDNGYSLSNQVFMGIDSKREGFFDALFVFLEGLPSKFRKLLSFYAGAGNAGDSYGVALSVFDDGVLSSIRSNNDFSGAMPLQKLIYSEGSLASSFVSCKEADIFLGLNNVDLEFLATVFSSSTDFEKYLACAHKIKGLGVEFSQDFELLSILGDSLSLVALQNNCFTGSFLKTVYKEQKSIDDMPLFREALKARFGSESKKNKKKHFTKKEAVKEADNGISFIKDEETIPEMIIPEDKPLDKKEKKGFSLAKPFLLFSAVFCLLLIILIPFVIFLWGTSTTLYESSNAVVISFDRGAVTFGLSLVILTVTQLPLGYLIITLIKKLFKK